MKVYISHAQQEQKVIYPFIALLFSAGLNKTDIICNSIPELSIENPYHYLKFLTPDEQIFSIYFLSESYYDTPSCLQEMGALYIVQKQSLSILLPGFSPQKPKNEIEYYQNIINLNHKLSKIEEDILTGLKEIWNFYHVSKPFSKITIIHSLKQFLDNVYPQTIAFDMRSGTMELQDTRYNNSCIITYKDFGRINLCLNFSDTDANACFLQFRTLFTQWEYFFRGNKKLCFYIHAGERLSSYKIKIQLTQRLPAKDILIHNGKNEIALSEWNEQAQQFHFIDRILFYFSKKDFPESVFLTFQNLHIE